MAGGGPGSDFKPRAGTLTLFYLASPMKRSLLRTMLAEAATGVRVLEDSDFVLPSDAAAIADVFADSYLVEPADPNLPAGSPIDENTKMRPTPAGREVPFVGETLQRWLRNCPAGKVEFGPAVGSVLGPLLTGWASAVTHALAAEPLTAGEVTEVVVTLDQSVVEERIESMGKAGQVEAIAGGDGETRYGVTDWLRRGIAPLAVAARLEHRHPPGDTAPIAARDVEAAFLLVLPLLKPRRRVSGTCSLTVELDEGVVGNPVEITVRVEAGRVVSSESSPGESADSWATGSVGDWLDAVIEGDAENMRTGGNRKLARALIGGLHRALFRKRIA